MVEQREHIVSRIAQRLGIANQGERISLAVGLMAMAFTACTDAVVTDPAPVEPPDEPAPQVLLEAPAPGEGVQYTMNTRLEAGVEAEHCQFVRAPEEGMIINRDLVRYTPGSHHFLLYQTSYEDIPTTDDFGTPVDTSRVFDCSEGPTRGWSVTKVIGGSQDADGDSSVSFPPGVGMRVPPGAVLLMNTHYLNASGQVLEPEVRINLYTIPEEELVVEGDLIFWYNIFINVDARSEGSAHMACAIDDDIVLVNAQSHMHAHGVSYTARTDDGQLLYTTDSWADVPVRTFADGLEISAGTTIDFQCEYRNGEDRAVYQGLSATDEMCMFVGSYYPAKRSTSLCSSVGLTDQYAEATRFLGADWIGRGSATCGETLQCLSQAGSADHPFHAITDCVLAASPEVAPEVSDLTRCMLVSADPQTACTAEIEACIAR